MKYIDSEKLIAEIERLYNIARDVSYNGEIEGEMTAYDKILSFIDSLQQEQPEVDLEKEIDELWKSLNTGHEYVVVDSYIDFLGICLHCFELGLNARKEE